MALQRGGNLVIPVFAVERSQELLHDIGLLIKNKEISPSRVFLDSPLASKVTAVYRKYESMLLRIVACKSRTCTPSRTML